ncbi:caspase family protein [Nocardioides sp. zg-536]|uniref:Caspase family protein n=1 Tax=Nocardioides faecalis TaxID=2803858 RepID=A0A938Y5A0_9ACTN|nr:caspase family protein [Nocardioides faecalis]MBM9459500.1 caspase family protein [Nocardioides faecalis]QVI59400.1 caspase family protein [Nocardioides faecalis]
MSRTRRALVVGVNNYVRAPLNGCVPDAVEIADRLRTNDDGSPNFAVETRISDHGELPIERPLLRQRIKDFFTNVSGMDLVFYFSGHGRQDDRGAELVTSELDGVPVSELMTLANGSAARTVTIILDCCFSGDVGNTPGLQSMQVAPDFRKEIAVVSSGVTVLAASKSTEVSMESRGHGQFTRLLLDGLDGAATDHLGNITALSLYAHASRAFDAWEQTPVFKANLADAVVLRQGPSWISVEDVRRLPQHFASEADRITLTLEHEGEGRPLSAPGTAEQQELDYLKRLRNVGLATTENDEDFYFATLNGHEVYLTPAGRMLWTLAKRGSV